MSRARLPLVAVLAVTLILPGAAAADGSWTAAGSIAVEQRWFVDDAAYPGQLGSAQPSAVLEPALRWRSAGGRHQVDLAAFGRLDGEDDERSHADLREGSYRYVGDSFELVAGVDRVFWGVTESRHLVDVVNQTDAVEDVDEEDKLGQPMLRLAFQRGWGRLELFSLLGFRERPFPGVEGRLRPPLPVDVDGARYASGADDERIDGAARYSRVAGDWDLGVHLFYGTGREPQLVVAAGGDRLVPLYRVTGQVGADVQYTRGAWLWKLEALAREGQGAAFAAAVAGVEHTIYQVGGSAADLGVLVELLWDGRDPTAPATIYDEDTFLGVRLAFNDIQSTRLLAGAVIDHDDRSVAAVIEGGRRLGQRFTLELEARLFANVDPAGDLAAVERDGFAALRIARHW